MWEKVKKFLGEVKLEMSKVSWPTREEAITSTAVVLIVVIFLSVFIGVNDFVYNQLLKLLLGK